MTSEPSALLARRRRRGARRRAARPAARRPTAPTGRRRPPGPACPAVQPHRVQRLQPGPQQLEVPVLGVAGLGRAVDVGADDVVDHRLHLHVQVLAVEHLAALVVDDGALAVEHLVVLQDVLADLEVLLLDLGLRRADRPADHLRLDRLVVGHPQRGHHRLEHRAVEPAHQVVAEGEVEPRLPRVALAAGAAAQLVVDPPALVPLGAQHVEATGLGDLLVLGLDLLLGRPHGVVPGGLVLLRRLGRRQPPGPQRLVGDEVGVAAELDVGAAAGHVGGHGDRAQPAGLGDDRAPRGRGSWRSAPRAGCRA